MGERYYEISESALLALIERSLELAALEAGGVDNWSSYGYSRHEFIEIFNDVYKCEEEIISECAKHLLKEYTVIDT